MSHKHKAKAKKSDRGSERDVPVARKRQIHDTQERNAGHSTPAGPLTEAEQERVAPVAAETEAAEKGEQAAMDNASTPGTPMTLHDRDELARTTGRMDPISGKLVPVTGNIVGRKKPG